jgi:hypothetical protein
MESTLLSSSPLAAYDPNGNWATPTRAKVLMLYKSGKGYKQIRNETKLLKSTIHNIIKSGSSYRTRKGKVYKKTLVSTRDLQRVFRYVAASLDNRCAFYTHLKAECNIKASTTTLRRALKAAGYRRCVACLRPFISRKQALKRFKFALKYHWWGTAKWNVVL